MEKNKTIFLVDGSGFIFRAYYALPSLTNKEGLPVGAVLGFCNMMLKLLEKESDDRIVVIFDSAKKTFRNDIFKEYKSNRGEAPEDLIPQFKLIRDAVDAFAITRVELAGYEADDLIATYTKVFRDKNWTVNIISSDKDLMQLVSKDVKMVDPIKNKIIGEKEVFEKFGVFPEKVIDVQSLSGDSVDNIPGAPGIGIKTASLLINEYGSLEGLLANYKEIKQNKRRESIGNNIERIEISKKLVSLKSNVDIDIDIDKISKKLINTSSLIPFLVKHNFDNLYNRVSNKYVNNTYERDPDSDNNLSYNVINNTELLDELIDKIYQIGYFSIDTETSSIKATEAKLIGLSLACQEKAAYYIPINHIKLEKEETQLDLETVVKKLDPLLEDPALIKIGQNLKYDILVLKNNGFKDLNVLDDTLLLSNALNAGIHNHNLDLLAEKYLGVIKKKYKDLVGVGKKEISFQEVPIKEACLYSCEDADITLRLWKIFRQSLVKNSLVSFYQNIENPFIKVVADMEKNGVNINRRILKTLSEDFERQLDMLQDRIYTKVKTKFNINSTKQLGEVLFNNLKLPSSKKNKSGGFSTSSEVLEKLSEEGYTIASLIIEWREITKLKTTYTDSLISSINDKTGRVHSSFQMTGAQTGRLSSTDPNLQNIPIKTANGKKIRKAFISGENKSLLCFDYSQIELRLLSEIANIKSLKEAFNNNVDIHLLTASQILNIPIEEVSNEQRRNAKAVNFGIIYGLSAFGLSKQLGITRSKAKEYIEIYFSQYPGIKEYMENTKLILDKNGFVKTLFGRRINIPGYKDKNPMVRNYAHRQAINAPIQGTAADIIKLAMIKFYEIKNERDLSCCNLVLQVHDELVFEVNNKKIEIVKDIIIKLMTNAHKPILELGVPLTVSFGKGKNWEEAH